MLGGFTVLLLCQVLGEALVMGCHLPLPGPVLGMALLVALLACVPRLHGRVEQAAWLLLRHMSLCFVPAGVGIVVLVREVAAAWLPIVGALVGSTVLALVATAFTMRGVMRLMHRGRRL